MNKLLKLRDFGKVKMCKRILKEQTSTKEEIPFFKISTFGDKADTFISKTIFESYKVKYPYPRKGDILISAAGTLGKTVIYNGEDHYYQDSNIVWLEHKEDIVLNRYLYYFYKTSPWVSTNGSTILRLYNDNILDIKISVPDLHTQQKIAAVLSALDDKIELNNKINAELEAMAKILYDYWFVQFDFPNEEGKPYKSSGGKMVYNPILKREIPEGWEVKKIKDIAKTGSGGTPKSTVSDYYEEGIIPWINSGEVNNPFIINTKNYISQLGLQNSSAKIFPAYTLLMAMYGATAGKVSVLSFEASTNQAICAVMPYDKNMFFYTKFVLEDMYKYLVSLSSGSARDNLSQDKIKDLNIVTPELDVLNYFMKNVEGIYNKIENNLKQNHELAQLRDWLLPMLMNGQVKVEDTYSSNEPQTNIAAEAAKAYQN
ncbi:restriction endonuclease subunit S [Sphingobacterium hotanense]|uniref:restriction endonuclease subunit S n=1 Tax=Sphingobacterium hotanense TaxID=649196 RepID=UPI0021A53C5E|nr:restriction endonuclease subunit S [Sphingobacterium hotanense]MCT1525334.1 restriction endonuclease subunit S [Sphingobacterium hotanense]